jgi:hypothetical protein
LQIFIKTSCLGLAVLHCCFLHGKPESKCSCRIHVYFIITDFREKVNVFPAFRQIAQEAAAFSKNGIDFSKIHGKQKAGAEKNCSGFSVSHMLHRVRTYALSSM